MCWATISNGPKSAPLTHNVLRHKIHHKGQAVEERKKGEVEEK